MNKHLLLSTLFLALFSSVFGKIFTVTNASGNDWFIGVHNNSLKAYLDSAASLSNPGRDTIEFNLPGGSQITGTMDPLAIAGSDVFINGLSKIDGLPVIMRISVSVTGTNVDFFGTAFQTSNHSLTLTGSNNSATNCTFATTGGGQNSVWINSGTGSLIKGCRFTAANLHGISVENGGSHTIDSCVMTGITDVGIILRGTGNNMVKKCSVSLGSHNGIGMIAGNNTVDSCVSFNNARAGIVVVDGAGNTIKNCVVNGNNTNFWLNGVSVPTPDQAGISSTGSNTIIENNFVYGNAANGILVNRTTLGANGSTVQNNIIGRDALGNEIGNGWNGVMVWMANGVTTSGNTIVNNGKGASHGVHTLPDRISGVRYQEVSSGTITNNFIGTDAAKTVADNEFDGITLHTTVSNISVTGNTVCHNGTNASYSKYGVGGGIALRNGANNCTIQGNFIGVHQDLTDGGNFDYGVSIEVGTGNQIGGSLITQGNIISNTKNSGATSADHGAGIWLVLNGNSGNTVSNNSIQNNAQAGILIERGARGNIIGTQGAGNIITGNTTGIDIKDNGTLNTNSNTLRHNSFACNTNKGIQLSDNGNNLFGGVGTNKMVTTVTADPRPNFVSGNAPAGSTVDIYSTASSTLTTCPATCKDDQYQGATYTGDFVIADASGKWEYDFVAGGNKVDQSTIVVTATETPTTGGTANTSEFSNCGCAAPTNVTISANDSTLCTGETALLTASANGMGSGTYSYKWYLGTSIVAAGAPVRYALSPIDTFRVSTAGTYFVKIADMQDTLGCVDSSAGLTIVVNTLPTINVAAAANAICDGESTTINSGQTGAANEVTLWSTGESTNPITVTTAGTYSVTITNTVTNCESSGSATLAVNPAISPTLANQDFCQGDSVNFDATVSGSNITYAWVPSGKTTPSIDVLSSGTHTVTVTNTVTGCSGQATAIATQSPDPKPIVTLSGTDTICLPKGESADLVASLALVKTGTFVWNKGASTDSLANIADSGYVSVTFTDAFNCTDTDSLLITNYCIPPISEVPNVFLPGGTLNPTFTPVGTITPSDVLESSFVVYNRWGRIMFETTDFPVWDGTLKGNPCSAGVYFWIWKYTDVTNTDYNLNGFVHLVTAK